jgi:hypothetical protein
MFIEIGGRRIKAPSGAACLCSHSQSSETFYKPLSTDAEVWIKRRPHILILAIAAEHAIISP